MRHRHGVVARPLLAAALAFATGPLVLASTAATPASAAETALVVSPEPGSQSAVPTTQISFLGRPAGELGAIRVSGSVSGLHAGRLEPYVGAPGASFVPNAPFIAGETVTVSTSLPIVGASGGSFSFVVANPVTIHRRTVIPPVRTSKTGVAHFVSAPALTPPALTVRGEDHELGDLVLAPKGSVGSFGPMITDGAGNLVYFLPLENAVAMDADFQTYEDRPVLTWWQGRVLDGHGVGEDVIVDQSYKPVATVTAGNGASADLHEFNLVSGDGAIITAVQAIRWDLEPAGGQANGTAWDGIVQEINVPTGLVMFQWDSLDHVPVDRSYFRGPPAENSPFDYFHVNAAQLLPNGRLLVSSRDTSAVYLVSLREDGEVLWTLGGKASSFAMGKGTEFTFQHDARLSGNTLTLFDNESGKTDSRALVLALNPTAKTVRLVSAYRDEPPSATWAFGNVEALDPDHLLVSWGTSPVISVLSDTGQVLERVKLPNGDDTYRTFAGSWVGTPTEPPALALRSAGADLDAYASWNGATGVATWDVLEGTSKASLVEVSSGATTGFETELRIPSAPLVEVEAVSASGAVLGHSAAIAAPIENALGR